MTGDYFALAGLDALLLAAGLGILCGAGLVHAPADALRLGGLAFLTGWAGLGVVGSFVLMAGGDLGVPEATGICLGLGAAGLAAGRFVPGAHGEDSAPRPGAHWLGVAGLGLLLVFLVALLRRALVSGGLGPDAWGFWLPKAKTIAAFGGLDTAAGGFTSFTHADYPPLVPALDAVALRFMGTLDVLPLHVQDWALTLAFFGALAGLLSRRVSPTVLWPVLAMLALMPAFVSLVGSELADLPLAILVATAGVCGALWLLDRGPRYLPVSGLLLAAAALTKTEGLVLALLLVVTLGVAALVARRPRGLLALLPVAAAPVLAVGAWRIWLSAHEVVASPDYKLGDLVSPGYLGDRFGRLGSVLADLPPYLLSPDRWLLTVPLALVAGLLVVRRRPPLAALVLAAVALGFAGLVAVYWVSRLPLAFHLDSSAERTSFSIVLLAGSLLPLLLAAALRDD